MDGRSIFALLYCYSGPGTLLDGKVRKLDFDGNNLMPKLVCYLTDQVYQSLSFPCRLFDLQKHKRLHVNLHQHTPTLDVLSFHE